MGVCGDGESHEGDRILEPVQLNPVKSPERIERQELRVEKPDVLLEAIKLKEQKDDAVEQAARQAEKEARDAEVQRLASNNSVLKKRE